jgi:hypothetical protein
MNWLPADDRLLRNVPDNKAAAAAIGCSEAAVRGRRQRLGLVPPRGASVEAPAPVEPASYEQDRERVGENHWKKQFDFLRKKYEKLLHERNVSEMLVEAVRESAPFSYSPAPAIPRRPGGKGSPQTMVVLLSDTHVGAVVRPEQTGGFGRYDFPTFLARLKFYEDAIVSILKDHTNTPVPELVLCLGGDMLDGMLNHGAESGQPNPLFTQFYGAGHAIAQFIRAVSAYVPQIRIYCTAGNHTRWGTQHRMPTNNRFSNFDTVLYAFLEALTRDLPTVKWNLNQQPFARFDIFGFRFQLLHGDTLRGGDKALGLPAHAIGRLVSATTSLCEKEETPAPHFFLTGHLHRQFTLPLAKGSFVINGGFPGLDGYGMSENFTPVSPTQVLFFVHPKFGKTATYDIQLRHAEIAENPPYTIPGEFPIQ